VSDTRDPAAELVQRLQRTYPDRQIDFVVCDRKLGANIKVSNLVQMLPHARHELLIVNDSDIRVPKDYLQRVLAPLADDQVGLVTCLYRGVARKTPGSRLEALGISADFVPGVLSARYLEKGLHFGLGSTLAFRRSDLIKIGGFEVLVDYLADDYELGRRIADTGKNVELSDAVVDTILPPYSLAEFFAHQMRWSRTIRDARRGGYIGLLMTYGFVWAMAMLLAFRGTPWAWALFGFTLLARLAVAGATAALVLGDEHVLGDFYLLPIRDMMAPAFWTGSLTGNRISWRGDDFELKDGRLTPVAREVSTK
jgi:ceramide glucosyltransferase